MNTAPVLTAAVEGAADEGVLRRICKLLGITVCDVYGLRGKSYILQKVSGYNNSALHRHWVVLVDLDNDFQCPGEAVSSWLPNPAPLMSFRIAVREIEAWLLGDPERIASFFKVSRSRVPADVEAIADPKQQLVNLLRRSQSRRIKEDMVPDPSGGLRVGPAYTSRLIEFVSDETAGWRPEVAATNSDSLQRAIARLGKLMTQTT